MRVRDVMKADFDMIDGKMTVKDALEAMKHVETKTLLVEKRHEDDEYGMVLLSDIAKQVLAKDRSPERVNIYEIMSKPVISVPTGYGYSLLRAHVRAVRPVACNSDRVRPCSRSCQLYRYGDERLRRLVSIYAVVWIMSRRLQYLQ